MAKHNRITFYDLALSTGATISPFVWATTFAVAHKGFEMDVVPGGFTGIMERTGGMSERLPAIVDDGKWVLDSWGIVEYLDATYPDRPMLIPHESVATLTRFLDTWLWNTATGPWMRCYCKDYRDLSLPQDHEYITRSRENMLGKTLEEMQAAKAVCPPFPRRWNSCASRCGKPRSSVARRRTTPTTAPWATSCSRLPWPRLRRWLKTTRCVHGSSAAWTCSAASVVTPGCSRYSACSAAKVTRNCSARCRLGVGKKCATRGRPPPAPRHSASTNRRSKVQPWRAPRTAARQPQSHSALGLQSGTAFTVPGFA